jgi:TonB family protein
MYPPLARQMKVVGTVILECIVDEEGRIASVHPTIGNPILATAAADATRKWRFKPFLEQERPATAHVTLTFEFSAR